MTRKGKLEAELTNQIVRHHREVYGRGPQDARAYIVDDMVIIRLKGVLTTEEKNLAQTEKGRQALKKVRGIIRETFAAEMEKMVSEATRCRVTSIHGDINTRTGESIEVFTLDQKLELPES